MQVERKLILLEVNEIPYRVLDTYCSENPGSNLASLMARSMQFESVTTDRFALDPWVSWPTLHRGVSDEIHGILHLGQSVDSADVDFPPIWQLVKRSGLEVGVFGSLHSSNVPEDASEYAFYVPDYFSPEAFAHPSALQPFHRLNLVMTRASARNVDRSIPGAVLQTLLTLPRLGIKARTIMDSVGQLVREFGDKGLKIRRRTYQSLVMSDIFVAQLKRTRPHLATFYTNHVAAAMHRYWGAAFPDDYESPMDRTWIDRYSGEINFAMEKLDLIVGDIVKFIETSPEYTLIVASSMGQAAIPAEETHEFLTISDLGRFMSKIGIPSNAWSPRPAMVPCQSVLVSLEYRDRVVAAMDELEIAGYGVKKDKRPVAPFSYDEAEPGAFQLFFQFDNYAGPRNARLSGIDLPFEELGLGFMQHEDGVNCTAQHVTQGSLLVYRPGSNAVVSGDRPRVMTVDVVPSVLTYFGLPIPAYVRGTASIPLAS